MLHVLAAALVMRQSLFSTVVPRPTGTNGYEDYLRAADALDTGELDRYDDWLNRLHRQDSAAQLPLRPSGVEDRDTDLDIRKKLASRFGQCLDYIRVGNTKSAWDPRPDGYQGKYPELSKFMRLGEVEAAAAHVDFSNGRSDQATLELIQGMTFAHRLSSGPPLMWMCGELLFSHLFAELHDALPQLSLHDARQLRDFALSEINAPSPAEGMLVRQAKDTAARLSSALDAPKELGDELEQDQPGSGRPLEKSIEALSTPGREDVKSQIASMVGDRLKQSLAVLSGLDQGLHLTRPPSEADDPNATIAVQLAGIVGLNTFGFGTVQTEARWRTVLRLLLLHAEVVEYKWLNGVLPDHIEQFSKENERLDLISRAPFIYKKEANWFRISRQGQDNLAELDHDPGSWWPAYSETRPANP